MTTPPNPEPTPKNNDELRIAIDNVTSLIQSGNIHCNMPASLNIVVQAAVN